jgi:hypothetical protein
LRRAADRSSAGTLDQLDAVATAPVRGIRTNEGVEVEFALAEMTLERYKWALNNVSVTTVAGPPAVKEIVLYRGVEVSRHACLVRGPSPYMDAWMQYQILVVIQTEEPEVAFVKDDKSVLACVFTSLIAACEPSTSLSRRARAKPARKKFSETWAAPC